jgi:ATP-dependent RNA helicase DeaD
MADRPAAKTAAGGQDRPPMARLYVGVGRQAGAGPQEIVATISREVGIRPDQIGTVETADRFSVVEVEEAVAEQVVKKMRKYRFAGRKIMVRPFVEE